MIADYVKTASAIYFGLSPQEVRKLAFECAQKFDIKVPEVWKHNGMAGPDWLSGFWKRNTDLSIRTPEATSLARATSFNRHNVSTFFDKLAEVMDRHHFEAADIWSFDETGVTTVQKPKKIVTAKGVKQVGAITSAEHGELVTVAVSVSADGKAIPPMFVLPRKTFKSHFLNGGPVGCIGVANSSGWMTESDFVTYMHHFIKHARVTISRPVLLLLDNHCSHLSVDALNLAKERGVVMLSFPPHCSHRLQPLDVGVYGPFKKYVAAAQDGWIRSNAGRAMSIYDIPQIVATALPAAATPTNICSGFKTAGILPFNQHIFSESDYLPSFVTDRPQPENQSTPSATETQAATAACLENAASSNANESVKFSPESVRPYLKAAPKKSKQNNRRKRQSAILTDTPVKGAIEKEKEERSAKKSRLASADRGLSKSKSKGISNRSSKTKPKEINKTACKKKVKVTVRENTCKSNKSLLPRRRSSLSLNSTSPCAESLCQPRRPTWLDKYKSGE